MTAPLDLAALRALVEQATPLPWAHDRSGVFHVESLGPILDEDRTRKGNAVGIGRVGDSYPRGDNHPTENMALIVAAVNALPALLDELEGLRQGEDAVRAFVAWLDAEDGSADYGTQTRETHPEGERIWRERWERNLRLCGEAQDKGHAFLATLDRARGEGRTDA